MQTKLFNIPANAIVMPCKNIKCTSEYGIKRRIKAANGVMVEDIHNGRDYIGDPNLIAVADGKVLFVTENDGTGSKTIVTAHGGILPNGYVLATLFAHCAGFIGKPKKNDPIVKNQIIAKMGMTGNATGIHLHCSMYAIPPEVWKNPTTGKYYEFDYKTREKYQIDPALVLGI